MEEADKGWMMIMIGVSGECFFWYQLTRVVPDKNGHKMVVCVCVCVTKLNLTQEKQTFSSNPKDITTQTKHNSKLKSGLIALYEVWPQNHLSLFLPSCGRYKASLPLLIMKNRAPIKYIT